MYSTYEGAKRQAKSVCNAVRSWTPLRLSQAQDAVAVAGGYRDWQHLHDVLGTGASCLIARDQYLARLRPALSSMIGEEVANKAVEQISAGAGSSASETASAETAELLSLPPFTGPDGTRFVPAGASLNAKHLFDQGLILTIGQSGSGKTIANTALALAMREETGARLILLSGHPSLLVRHLRGRSFRPGEAAAWLAGGEASPDVLELDLSGIGRSRASEAELPDGLIYAILAKCADRPAVVCVDEVHNRHCLEQAELAIMPGNRKRQHTFLFSLQSIGDLSDSLAALASVFLYLGDNHQWLRHGRVAAPASVLLNPDDGAPSHSSGASGQRRFLEALVRLPLPVAKRPALLVERGGHLLELELDVSTLGTSLRLLANSPVAGWAAPSRRPAG